MLRASRPPPAVSSCCPSHGLRAPWGHWCRLPVPARSLSGDSPAGLGRSWSYGAEASRPMSAPVRAAAGSVAPCPGKRPPLGASPGCSRAPSAPRGRGQRESREVPGRARGGRTPGKPASLGPSPRDSPLAVAALQLTPALGPASPLAHLRAPRASRSPPASPHRTSHESSSLGDLKVSARSPKSCHAM